MHEDRPIKKHYCQQCNAYHDCPTCHDMGVVPDGYPDNIENSANFIECPDCAEPLECNCGICKINQEE